MPLPAESASRPAPWVTGSWDQGSCSCPVSPPSRTSGSPPGGDVTGFWGGAALCPVVVVVSFQSQQAEHPSLPHSGAPTVPTPQGH